MEDGKTDGEWNGKEHRKNNREKKENSNGFKVSVYVWQEWVGLCRKAVEIMQSECCLLVEDSKDPVNEERFICILTPFWQQDAID